MFSALRNSIDKYLLETPSSIYGCMQAEKERYGVILESVSWKSSSV